MSRFKGAGSAAVLVLMAFATILATRHHDGDQDARPAQRRERSGASSDAVPAADPSRGASLFGQCATCHPIGRGSDDRDGPNLYGVVGSPVAGRRPRFAYTAALRRLGGIWSVDRLDAWLADPAALVPGTTMAFPGMADARDRADVIAYLASQGSRPLDRP